MTEPAATRPVEQATEARRARVLFLVPMPPPFGGVEAACQSLLQSPLREQFDIVVVNSNIRETNRARGRMDFQGVFGTVRLCVRLAGTLARARPRVVFTTLSMSRTGLLKDAALILTARVFGCPVLAHYHQSELFPMFVASQPVVLQRLARFVLSQLRMLLVLGRDIAPAFVGLLPVGRIRVLHNGLIQSALPGPSGGKSPGAGGGEVTLLFLGDVSFRKGFADLVTVYRRLRRRFPQLRLRFAGEVVLPDRESFFRPEYLPEAMRDRFARAEAEISGFLADVRAQGAEYLGLIDAGRKWAELQRADIFVLPSYSEGLSIAVLEAMAVGLPVVTTKVGAMREVVEDGISGFLIERGDLAALEGKLAALIADRDLGRRFGEAGRRIFEGRFDSIRVADDCRGILAEVLAPLIRVRRDGADMSRV